VGGWKRLHTRDRHLLNKTVRDDATALMIAEPALIKVYGKRQIGSFLARHVRQSPKRTE
jgi:hypothetical protein